MRLIVRQYWRQWLVAALVLHIGIPCPPGAAADVSAACCRCAKWFKIGDGDGFCRGCNLMCGDCQKELGGDLQAAWDKLKGRNRGLREAYEAFEKEYKDAEAQRDQARNDIFGVKGDSNWGSLDGSAQNALSGLAGLLANSEGAGDAIKVVVNGISLYQGGVPAADSGIVGATDFVANSTGAMCDYVTSDYLEVTSKTAMMDSMKQKGIRTYEMLKGNPNRGARAAEEFRKESKALGYSDPIPGKQAFNWLGLATDIYGAYRAADKLASDYGKYREAKEDAQRAWDQMQTIADEIAKNAALMVCIQETIKFTNKKGDGGKGAMASPRAHDPFGAAIATLASITLSPRGWAPIAANGADQNDEPIPVPPRDTSWQPDDAKLQSLAANAERARKLLDVMGQRVEGEIIWPLLPFLTGDWKVIEPEDRPEFLKLALPHMEALASDFNDLDPIVRSMWSDMDESLQRARTSKSPFAPYRTGTQLKVGPHIANPPRWFVTLPGQGPERPLIERTKSATDPISLPPGRYDIYCSPGENRKSRAILLGKGVDLSDGMQSFDLRSGVRFASSHQSHSGGARDRDWFAAAPAGRPLEEAFWADDPDAMALPPGLYDLYWSDHPNAIEDGVLIAKAVTVAADAILEFTMQTGTLALRAADWVPKHDGGGWWGVMQSGQPSEKPAQMAKADKSLTLPTGEYDVYWNQGWSNNSRPLCIAQHVNVESGKPSTIAADCGIRLIVADWVPRRDGGGWWAVTQTGKSPDELYQSTTENSAILLVPGSYDVYWNQGWSNGSQPLLLASNIQVAPGSVADAHANSGIRLRFANRAPAPKNGSWWGVAPAGGSEREMIQKTTAKLDQPLLLAPGTYDVLYDPGYSRDVVLLKSHVAVENGQLVEVNVDVPGE